MKASRGHRTLAITLRSTHPLIWVVCAQTASFEPGIVGDYIEYLETIGDEVITAIAIETSVLNCSVCLTKLWRQLSFRLFLQT